MKYIYEMKMKVRDYEVDSEGIVNNAVYLHYLEHTRHEFCEWAGLRFRDMHARGIDPVVRRVEIDYLSPLTLGETMTSRLALRREGPRFIFTQDIYHHPSEVPAVKATVTIVSVENGRLTRGDVLAEAFNRFIEDDRR